MSKENKLKKEVHEFLDEKSDKEIDKKILKEYVDELEKKELDLEEELKHQVAELRNSTKRRDEKEADLRKYSSQKLGEMIIPDIDLFKKVLKSVESIDNQELKNYLQGFEMIVTKMDNTLNEVGIKEFEVELGSEFDPHKQESVEQIETDKYESGKVAQVVSNGYMIHDRVLIHAKVKVAK